MKPTKTFALALSAFVAAGLPLRAETVVNRPIATVNGESILLSEFDKNWGQFSEQQKTVMPAEKMTADWEKETKKKILDQMIDDKILLQEAKKRKTRVNQRDLENGVVQVKSRFLPESGRRDLDALVQKAMAAKPAEERGDLSGVDLAGLWKDLAKTNPGAVKEADDKFKEELAKEGLTDKKFQDRIKDQLSVIQLTQSEVHTRTKQVSDDDAHALFDKLTQIMQGKDPAAKDEESAADLKSMAKFFEAQSGERVRARHILLRVPADASFKDKSAARRKIDDLRAKIAAGADFAELAEKNSDDKASAVRGGDLGPFTRGQMVPAFDKAVFALAVGEVSPVVETEFGYHIIKVDEKRAAAKVRYEDVEDDLKEYIFRAGQQEAFEGFVKELRKSAAIKVLIDVEETVKKAG